MASKVLTQNLLSNSFLEMDPLSVLKIFSNFAIKDVLKYELLIEGFSKRHESDQGIIQPVRTMVMVPEQSGKNSSAVLDTSCKIHTQASPLLFHVSDKLCAEPMKRKKKLDPAIAAAKTQKKLKRIDKEIKRLSRIGKILKPVEEIEVDRRKLMGSGERKREPTVLTFEESESRALLHKNWTGYRTNRHYEMVSEFSKVAAAQQEALEELRAESEELYQAAIKIDEVSLPLTFEGPKETPPIQGYNPPDGEYIDTTRKF